MPPEIVQWLQNMSLATAIRESAIVFPVILSLHLTGMGLFGGMLLMWSKAAIYYPNPYLRLKLVIFALIIIHAVVFRGVYRHVADLDHTKAIPRRAKMAAVLSMVLWISVLSAGRWIGYWEPKGGPAAADRVVLQLDADASR